MVKKRLAKSTAPAVLAIRIGLLFLFAGPIGWGIALLFILVGLWFGG
jgi:hypothetical protein